MIKAVLYDMDGTVLDTSPLYLRGWQEADDRLGYGGKLAAELPNLAGRSWPDGKIYMEGIFGADYPYEAVKEIVEKSVNEQVLAGELKCKSGAPEVFDRLREMGICQILVTSSPNHLVYPYLQKAGIENTFDAIVTAERVTHSKPNPEIYFIGASLANATPDECIVVEDAANGARAGINAKMRTVFIPEHSNIPEDVKAGIWRQCETLAELPALIKSLNGQA